MRKIQYSKFGTRVDWRQVVVVTADYICMTSQSHGKYQLLLVTWGRIQTPANKCHFCQLLFQFPWTTLRLYNRIRLHMVYFWRSNSDSRVFFYLCMTCSLFHSYQLQSQLLRLCVVLLNKTWKMYLKVFKTF